MRWLWFITITLLVFLAGLFTRWYFIWVLELILIDIYFTRLINWKIFDNTVINPISQWLQISVWIIITSAILRIFVLDTIYVVNAGMEPTIKKGDNLLVSKISYGPRLPMTPFNFPFTHQYLPFSDKPSYLEKPAMPYKRLNGFGSIKQGDLVVYNFPEGDSVLPGQDMISYYAESRLAKYDEARNEISKPKYRPVDRRIIEVGRIIGLPGDTIAFYDGNAKINNNDHKLTKSRSLYILNILDNKIISSLLEEFEMDSINCKLIPNKGYVLSLSMKEAEKVKIRYGLTIVQRVTQNSSDGNLQVFPHNRKFVWNSDYFGPVIVPQKNKILDLNISNISLYERLISNYEGNKLFINDGKIYINNSPATKYKVKMDYYFVAGDNRPFSRDSRHWGFLPEDHIIGQPWFICLSLSSLNENKLINWDRMFDIVK